MTNNIAAAHALLLAIGVALAYVSIQFALRPAIIDSFRQRIFAIRRESFVLAAQGLIRNDDPEYVATRFYFNGLLRFAESFTFLRLIVGVRVYRNHKARLSAALFELPSSPYPDVSKRLWRARDRATDRLLWHLFQTSPIAWIVVLFYLPGVLWDGSRKDRSDERRGVRRTLLAALSRVIPRDRIEREVTGLMEAEGDCTCPVAA
jgi:hypothetical protein